jgi:hypothetical protein
MMITEMHFASYWFGVLSVDDLVDCNGRVPAFLRSPFRLPSDSDDLLHEELALRKVTSIHFHLPIKYVERKDIPELRVISALICGGQTNFHPGASILSTSLAFAITLHIFTVRTSCLYSGQIQKKPMRACLWLSTLHLGAIF